MPRRLTLRPCAKINLTLRVGAVRPDGFHDVHTLLQSIALADRLTIVHRRGPFALETTAADVPSDRTNLVWRAADRLWRALGRAGDARDVDVRLEKHVPVGAGLGGGSADAAAALAGLHAVWGGRLSHDALLALAAELGADVPFLFSGGTAVGVGRGDELLPVDDVRRLHLAIIKPSTGVATADAYRWHDEDHRRRERVERDETAPQIDVGWRSGGVTLVNDLQPAVVRRHPVVGDAMAASRAAGAIAASMTGSGSAVFAVFSREALPRAIARLARPDWVVLRTRTMSRREARRGLGV